MKSFAIILVVCLAGAISAVDETEETNFSESENVCIAESGVDRAKLNVVGSGDIDETDGKLACFVACIMKKMGIMDANGAFNETAVRSKIRPGTPDLDKVDETINKCKTITGTDDCDTARKIHNCCNEYQGANMFHKS